jgi:hypothetical protein
MQAVTDHQFGTRVATPNLAHIISEALASRRGIGRACLAAYGDAVVPEIAEAIGRVVMRLDYSFVAGGLCAASIEKS